MDNYPPGAAYDPRAPWNEQEEGLLYCACGNPALYARPHRFEAGMRYEYYCQACLWEEFTGYLAGYNDMTFEGFLNENEIEEL